MSAYKLGDIVNIKKGRKVENTSDVYLDGSKRFIQIDDLRNDNKIKYTKSEGVFATENDVLIAWDGANAGTVGYGLSGVIGSTIASLEINKNQFVGAFIGKCLQSKFHEIRQNCTGATIPHIRRDYLLSIRVPNIDKHKQKQIVQTLDTADSLRQKRKEQLNLLDDYLKSVFFEMFGDPVRNNKSWPYDKLSALSKKIGSGATPRGGKSSYKNEGIALIRSMNIHDNKFDYKGIAYIDDMQADDLRNVIVQENDVLFNITGASVCRCTIVPKEILPARVNQHVAIIRPNEKVSSVYLSFLLTSESFKHFLLRIANAGGATREAITKEDLKKLSIPTPPIDLQNKFASIVEQVEQTKQKMRVSLDEMDNHFNALMQRYFG